MVERHIGMNYIELYILLASFFWWRIDFIVGINLVQHQSSGGFALRHQRADIQRTWKWTTARATNQNSIRHHRLRNKITNIVSKDFLTTDSLTRWFVIWLNYYVIPSAADFRSYRSTKKCSINFPKQRWLINAFMHHESTKLKGDARTYLVATGIGLHLYTFINSSHFETSQLSCKRYGSKVKGHSWHHLDERGTDEHTDQQWCASTSSSSIRRSIDWTLGASYVINLMVTLKINSDVKRSHPFVCANSCWNSQARRSFSSYRQRRPWRMLRRGPVINTVTWLALWADLPSPMSSGSTQSTARTRIVHRTWRRRATHERDRWIASHTINEYEIEYHQVRWNNIPSIRSSQISWQRTFRRQLRRMTLYLWTQCL